jgi:hypothetical protein
LRCRRKGRAAVGFRIRASPATVAVNGRIVDRAHGNAVPLEIRPNRRVGRGEFALSVFDESAVVDVTRAGMP